MTRAEIVTLLGAWYSELLADAGLLPADSSGNLKQPVDAALRGLGIATASLATAVPDDDVGFFAQAEYHTLRRIVRVLATRFDVTTGGDSYRLRQSFENATALLAEAEAAVLAMFGSLVPTTDDGGIVALDLNFLELADADLVAAVG